MNVKKCGRLLRQLLKGKNGLWKCYSICSLLLLVLKLIEISWLCLAFRTGAYAQRKLTINDFQQYDVEVLDSMTVINETDDSQLWLCENVYNLYVDVDFSTDPGEFVLFYSYQGNGDFRADRCVYAKQIGKYSVFELPVGVRQIRLDTGIFPSVTVSFNEILLNKYDFRTATRSLTEDLFYLLTVPAMAYGILDVVFEVKDKTGSLISPFKQKKTKLRRDFQ